MARIQGLETLVGSRARGFLPTNDRVVVERVTLGHAQIIGFSGLYTRGGGL